MRKYVFILAAAVAMTACSKTEVIPAQNETLAEITYETAPVTRTIVEFGKDNVFSSIAYYLENGKTWDWGYATSPVVYIGAYDAVSGSTDGVKISKSGNVWRNADRKYYWPKKGTLTFFAWSLNSDSLELNFPATDEQAGVFCTPYSGIIMNCFSTVLNKNVDFMVADIAKDKTANETEYINISGVESGVPTLFRHKLTNIYFTVKQEEEYSGVKFTLNSIIFRNLSNTGNYNQVSDEMNAMTASGYRSDQTYTAGADQVVTVDKKPIAADKVDQFIYIPQTFTSDNQTVEITYTVEYTTSTGETITENITESRKLSGLFKKSAGDNTGEWAKEKKYTIDLTFALDEILWDPAVQDWDPVDSEDITVNK